VREEAVELAAAFVGEEGLKHAQRMFDVS